MWWVERAAVSATEGGMAESVSAKGSSRVACGEGHLRAPTPSSSPIMITLEIFLDKPIATSY